ncbi:hypothetical protein K504DRAFT_530228 [Pleomassaria siparia CBS 279.74]|uniref:Rhodopsin domain-containing protein n=1 Tax=Pleomassaria siparia CBS 279.74 TaxID=1314801 RepID=A0A6G1KKP2_9PLEO|nr:hypothetical protein K504DRAFT_530228 [Pleomassaria siparia CBS 279.74]
MSELIVSKYQFATVTSDDHGGIIYITAFLTFTYSALTFITRCAIKWRVFGLDDWATCVAQAISVVQFALLLASLSAGLGRSFNLLNHDQYIRMASFQYANQILFYFSLGLSKCAAVMLIQRLFPRDATKSRLICNIVIGLMVTWTVLASLMVSTGCSARSTAPHTAAGICPGIYARYLTVAIMDACTDVLLILVPAYLIWQLQMRTHLKLQVVSVFAFRLPLIPLSFLAVTAWHKSLHGSNPGVERASAIIFQQSELCFSLIAGTVPCVKSFIRSFDTGSGVKAGFTSNGYNSSGYARGLGYRMQPLNTNEYRTGDTGSVQVNERSSTAEKYGREKTTSTTPFAVGPKPKDDDAISHGSQEMFIRRDVQFEVH